jgi:phasin family protein
MNPQSQIQAAQRAEVECLTDLFDAAMDGFEQLTRLQLQAMREFSRNHSRRLFEAMQARDARDWAALPQQALRPDPDGAMQYLQEFGRIAGSVQAAMSEALQQGAARLQRQMQEAAAQAGAPAAPEAPQRQAPRARGAAARAS